MVEKEIHGNGVIHGDSHHLHGADHFDVFLLGGNLQVLDLLENDSADLFFVGAVNYRETRLLLHLVGQFVLGNINRQKFEGQVNGQHQNDGVTDRFEAA